MSEAVGALDKGKHKEGVGEFIKKTRGELDKTTFPTSEDVQKTTIIVIISVIFFALYLFVVDYVWTYLIQGMDWAVNRIMGI